MQRALQFVGSIEERWAPRYLNFAGGLGYLFACKRECAPDSAFSIGIADKC